MKEYTFLIYGIEINFKTDNERFAQYVSNTLENFKSESGQYNETEPFFYIQTTIGFSNNSKVNFGSKIGNGVFLNGDNEIVFDHKLFNGQFSNNNLNGNQLYIKGYPKKGIKEALKTNIKSVFIPGYSYQDIIFHQLYRELVLLPVFWILRYRKKMYLMHASAVTTDSKTYVFLGNDGVGKTTVAMQLFKERKAGFFGDNFLLFDSNRIYPFVDTIRINRQDTKGIKFYEGDPHFKLAYSAKARNHYTFSILGLAEPTKPTHFFVLKQGKENMKVNLNRDQFVDFSFAINDYVREFDKYSYTSNLLFLFGDKENGSSISEEGQSIYN